MWKPGCGRRRPSSPREATAYLCVRDEATGCLVWMGGVNPSGYAAHWAFGPLHRAVYREVSGSIPRGWHVDHVYSRGCRYRACVEPAHLEGVPPAENYRRAVAAVRLGHRTWDRELLRPGGPLRPHPVLPSIPDASPPPAVIPRTGDRPIRRRNRRGVDGMDDDLRDQIAAWLATRPA